LSTPIHLMQIEITRREPGNSFDAEKAARELASRFSCLAKKIVVQNILIKPVAKKNKKVETKVESLIEHDERLRSVRGFLECWNKWREFYFDLSPIKVKTKGQLTVIEGAIQYMEENEYNMHMMIACIHKGFQRRSFRPSFNTITLYGEELYDQFISQVHSDVERREHARQAEL